MINKPHRKHKNKFTLTENSFWKLDLTTNKIFDIASENLTKNLNSEIMQYSIEDWLSLIFEPDRKNILNALKEFKSGKQNSISLEHRTEAKNSKLKWIKLDLIRENHKKSNNSAVISVHQFDISKYKLSEQLLQKSNLRLKYLVDKISGGIIMEDDSGKIVYANKQFCRLFILDESPYNLIGMELLSVIKQISQHIAGSEHFIKSATAARDNGIKETNQQYKLIDGSIIEREFIPIYDDDKLDGNIWIFRDITELKQNEERLNFRLAFEDIILKLSSEFINVELSSIDKVIEEALKTIGAFINADRSYVFLFSQCKNLMSNTHEWVSEGISPEKENLQNIPTDIFPWWIKRINNFETINLASIDDLPAEAQSEKSILEQQDIKSLVVVPIIFNNKSIGYLGFDAVNDFREWTKDSTKLLKVAAGVFANGLKRKENESELRRFSKAVETTQTAIILLNLQGEIVYVNNGLINIAKYKSADLLGKKIFDFTDEEGIKILRKEIIPNLRNGNNWNGELKLKRAGGAMFHAELVCSNVLDDFGETQFIVVNFFDITDRIRAEEETRKALEKEKELNDLKSKFISMVSHEFRTPLTSILSSSELLQMYWDQCDSEKRNSLLDKISNSIKILVEILEDVSEINKADYNAAKLNVEVINFTVLIKEILDEVIAGKKEHPKINLVISKEINIHSDKQLLRQVIHNLISNAVKYTPSSKSITLKYQSEKTIFKFIVEDEGIGIPIEEQKNIYEPFIRCSNSISEKGTGLGLSIVKRAVEKLNGTIDFKSTENKGTIFTVSLPRLLM